MSYALPRTGPDAGRPRFQSQDVSTGSAGVAEKIGGMFGDRRPSLPMYKDKPFAGPKIANFDVKTRRREQGLVK
jgi:mannosyl-oligosaccharide alpha-1,2-mannosidase